MRIPRQTRSLLGKSIVKDVTDFIYQNEVALERTTNLSSKEGAEIIANAICYAIAKALSNPKVRLAFNAGIVPPNGVPGTLIYNALQPQVIEP
jgi:hypothetical protein